MELLLLSIALAMDAAALSIANGAKYRNLALSKILFIAFVFGFFQAAMPLAGYFWVRRLRDLSRRSIILSRLRFWVFWA